MKTARSPAPDPTALPFRKERILAVGTLAMAAPVPFLFNRAIGLGPLFVYFLVLGGLLLRVRKGDIPCLSRLTLNLSGVLCFVYLYVDTRVSGGGLRTAVQALLLAFLVRLASIARERDFSVAMVLMAFLLVGSVASSFHVTILIFLPLFTLLAWPLLARWALWRDLAGVPEEYHRQPAISELPGRKATLVASGLSFLLAIPFFFVLPRLRSPYVTGAPVGGGDVASGFSESIDADTFGTLKANNEVYVRVSGDSMRDLTLHAARLRTLTFSSYDGRRWTKPLAPPAPLTRQSGAAFALPRVPREPALGGVLAVELKPIDSRYLPHTSSTSAVRLLGPEADRGWVLRDGLGNLQLLEQPHRAVRYELLHARGPRPDRNPPPPDDPARLALGSSPIREFMSGIAAGLDPERSPDEIARRLEEFLSTRLTYSTVIPKSGTKPVEEFLFVRKAGHCEAFATAMAMSLREIGIPTRVVSGFAGGETGFFGNYLVFRGSDAHAWVEVWTGFAKGWVPFDPTPAAGRPQAEALSWQKRVTNLSDGVEFLFDRYILNFDQNDQLDALRLFRDALEKAFALFQAISTAVTMLPGKPIVVVAFAIALVLSFFAAPVKTKERLTRLTTRFRIRGLPPTAAAYRRLQRLLTKAGARLTPASAPGETLLAAKRFGADAEGVAREIVAAYVSVSFGGTRAETGQRAKLARLLKRARGAMRKRRS